jgi:hypothetical protein
MGVEGNIENYRYYGDKVFGANPSGTIKIYGSLNGASTESDHQMVIATFETADEGGRRKRKNKKTQRRQRIRKTRKPKHY